MEFEYKNKLNRIVEVIKVIILASIVGIVTGCIAAIFGRVLIAITDFRYEYAIYLIPFLGFAGALIVYTYNKYGGISKKGMLLVFGAGHGVEKEIPLIMIPLVIVGTWLTHLFGGSAGREGVAVQIGGTVGYRIGKVFNDENMSRILLIAGMAAGFSGLFRTPIAAVFFALEVLTAGEIKYRALIPAIFASICAYTTSMLCGLEKFSVNLNDNILYNPVNFIKLIIVGLAFGLAGRLFSMLLKILKQKFAVVVPEGPKRAFVFGIGISIILLLLYKGRYAGLGTNLIASSFSGEKIYAYDWILKLLLTVITLAAGYQGGEVTPLFAIGATLGMFLGTVLGMPPMLIAALGYAAVFSSATNTILGPIFIGAEVFGFSYMPLFALVCAIAYSCNGNLTIYPKQKIVEKEIE